MGVLLMIRDDWTDFRVKHEREGNLVALVHEGRARVSAVRELVDRLAREAAVALQTDPSVRHLAWAVEDQRTMLQERLGRLAAGTPRQG